jgi:hypothetical protein
MARDRNSDIVGRPFGAAVIEAVWRKGREIVGYDPWVWRYDICGQPIRFSDYGNTGSPHGWEVDHIKPVAKGGSDDFTNLQPLQWENNRRKSNTYPWSCR